MYFAKSKGLLGLLGVMLATVGSQSMAEELWTAFCVDGQRLSYAQKVDGPGQLALQVTEFRGNRTHQLVLADLKQTFKNEVSICGTPSGNQVRTQDGQAMPMSQICMNKSRQIIYMGIVAETRAQSKSGIFCRATVRVRQR